MYTHENISSQIALRLSVYFTTMEFDIELLRPIAINF